jgi:hypothetical protein
MAIDSGAIRALVYILNGYHLTLLENALRALVALVADEVCAKECFKYDPFKKLAVIIGSQLESVRVQGRLLFNKLYEKAGSSLITQESQ